MRWFGGVVLFGGVIGTLDVVGVDYPKVALYGHHATLKVTLSFKPGYRGFFNYTVTEVGRGIEVDVSGTTHPGYSLQGYQISDIELSNAVTRELEVKIASGEVHRTETVVIHGMPAVVTLLPIVALIVAAVVSGQALIALALGLFLASTFINGFNPVAGFLRMMDHYTVTAVASSGNAQVILFTLYLSGLIAMIQKSGGAHGLAKQMSRFATNRWRGQWATLMAGVAIFFDDFASCLIVGSNMQPVTDALALSREKLAFLVHATSSPPASIAPISSWTGFELLMIKRQLQDLGIEGEPFLIFLETIPSRFYPLYMLMFVIALLILKRDFGPMLDAERRTLNEKRLVSDDSVMLADATDPLAPDPSTPQRWFNAVAPILVVIVTTLVGMFLGGYYAQAKSDTPDYSAKGLASAGNSAESLLYGSFLGSVFAMVLFRLQGLMSFEMLVTVYIIGVKEVAEALLILILAWSIGSAFTDLRVADCIVSVLSASLDPRSLPTLIFIISCIISFTTGTSWGTMSIMFPLVVPLAHSAAPDNRDILVYCISSILTGAIFGDQCSPISGTSILSAMASRCPLNDHVTTQLPYALLVAFVSITSGYLPLGFGLYPTWAALLIGAALLSLSLFLLGTKTESNLPSRWHRLLRKLGRSPNAERDDLETQFSSDPSPTTRKGYD
ncbi:hypothetical protein L0F63_000974 [Massospora cicadina]|nr:hypothetical protein L0F63_000974 [Massospora cicadina]